MIDEGDDRMECVRSVLVPPREQEQPLALGVHLNGNLLDDLLSIDDLRHEFLLLPRDGKDWVRELLVFVPRFSYK